MNGRQTADDALSSLPSIAVVIVNYGTAELALEAAESALSQDIPNHRVHLHIVDNASPGNDAHVLAEQVAARGWQDRVTLLPEGINHGFGRANNLVLSALSRQSAAPSYVFLLNPDAILEKNALASLVALLDARPDVAGVGAGVSRPDGYPVTAAFRFPSLLGELERAAAFAPVSRMLRKWRIPLPPDQPEGPVDWVTGAAVLFRLEALCQVGFFDASFFLYFEEVDLMRRLTSKGWTIWYLPSARVRHVEGASTGVTSGMKKRKPAYWFESWALYHRRAGTRTSACATALAHLTGTVINALNCRLRRLPSRLNEHYFRDFLVQAFLPLLRS